MKQNRLLCQLSINLTTRYAGIEKAQQASLSFTIDDYSFMGS